jgi:hypothetical protein
MNPFTKFGFVLAAALSLGTAVLAKETTSGGPGGGRPEAPERPEAPKGGKPQIEIPKFKLPPNAEIPADLKALITQYQDAAQKFAAQQKELLAQIKGATDEQKQKLKETLKGNRQTFLDDTTQLRADIREQLRELRAKLKDSAPTTVDPSGEGKGKGRPGRP